MAVGLVRERTIEFLDVDHLDRRTIDKILLHKSEEIPLNCPDGEAAPFVAFVRRGGVGARSSVWHKNVLITRLGAVEAEVWLSGPVVVAARAGESVRGLTPAEQGQLQIWGTGRNLHLPLLMVADPEPTSTTGAEKTCA